MNISEIKNWFNVAIPEPTIEQASIQLGCHYEEVSEMLLTTGDYEVSASVDNLSERYKKPNAPYLHQIIHMHDGTKVQLLDDLCDQIVTAIGVAHMLGMDIEGALKEVNRSNHSKFVDGKAVFNEQGKIDKGEFYSRPELDKFIGSK